MVEASTLHLCVVCSKEKPCTQSLRLLREKGVWTVQPVCPKCRYELIEAAKAKGQFIPFFSLETSLSEAAKRNEEAKEAKEEMSLKFKPFLEKFGRDRDDKVVNFPRGKKTTTSKRSFG